eukprot:TRINITY_DN799_c0_g1_i1.p1 TRINITY_DN799_c0_g1~~TRINITY_DN799_c0_g1_i1.p1  ORF type:complete len:365 (-),score=99.48 TRINITY_DN799_c0_g1_i1:1479-2573(-)
MQTDVDEQETHTKQIFKMVRLHFPPHPFLLFSLPITQSSSDAGIILPVKHSISGGFNQLSCNGTTMAYFHRYEIHLANESACDTGKAPATVRAHVHNSADVTQVKWCKEDLLVMTHVEGLQMFSGKKASKRVFEYLTPVVEGTEQVVAMNGIGFVNGTNQVVAGSSTGDLYVFDEPEGSSSVVICEKPTAVVSIDNQTIMAVATDETDKESNIVAVSDVDGNLRVLEASKDQEYTTIATLDMEDRDCATCLGVRGDNVIAGYTSGHIRVFSIKQQRMIVEIAAHARAVSALSMHPSESQFATVGEDTAVFVWTLPDEQGENMSVIFNKMQEDAYLQGVAFVGELKNKIATAAYDTDFITVFDLP